MKVLICIDDLPPVAGGAEQVAWETAKRLNKLSGVEINVLCKGSKGYRTYVRDSVKIYEAPSVPNKFIDVYYSTVGFRKLRSFIPDDFDVIHAHMARPWMFALRKHGGKKIVSAHGSDVYPKKLFKGRYVQQILKSCDMITTCSQWMADYVLKTYGVPAQVVGNGVDLDVFSPPKEFASNNTVLFVGRFVKRKGVEDLIAIARELPEYEFWFVGKGPLRDKINLSNTKVLGFVEDIAKIYGRANICVFPSHWEPFGIVGLEAMACGTPVVATNQGFSTYIENGKNGLLVDSQNPLQLKDAVVKLMSDPTLRSRMRVAGLNSVKNFSWDRITEQYYDLYKHVAGG